MAKDLCLASVASFFFVLCSTILMLSGQSHSSVPRSTCLRMCDDNRGWLCGMLCQGVSCSSCRFTMSIENYIWRCRSACPADTVTWSPPVQQKSCGMSQVGRIVGGEQAEECEFPWTVMILVGSIYCGGSIIDSNTVLTAGHCLSSSRGLAQPSSVRVKYGSSDQWKAKVAYVIRVQVHPQFYHKYFDNDVALLTLDRHLQFNRCVQPVCLPEVDASPYHTEGCLAAGWGAVDYTRPSAQRILRKVSLPIVSMDECRKAYNPRLISNIKICAGDLRNGGIDSCMGDSGGPFMCYQNGAYYVFGVVSFGRACARPGSPGVYSRVPSYQIISWIKQNM